MFNKQLRRRFISSGLVARYCLAASSATSRLQPKRIRPGQYALQTLFDLIICPVSRFRFFVIFTNDPSSLLSVLLLAAHRSPFVALDEISSSSSIKPVSYLNNNNEYYLSELAGICMARKRQRDTVDAGNHTKSRNQGDQGMESQSSSPDRGARQSRSYFQQHRSALVAFYQAQNVELGFDRETASAQSSPIGSCPSRSPVHRGRNV